MASSEKRCRMIFQLGRPCMATKGRWSQSGVWEQVNQTLPTAVRIEVGREEDPS